MGIAVGTLIVIAFLSGCKARSVYQDNQKTLATIERVSKIEEAAKEALVPGPKIEPVSTAQTPKDLFSGPPQLNNLPQDARPKPLDSCPLEISRRLPSSKGGIETGTAMPFFHEPEEPRPKK